MARMETVRCYTASDIRRIEKRAIKRAFQKITEQIKLILGLTIAFAIPFLAMVWWVMFGY